MFIFYFDEKMQSLFPTGRASSGNNALVEFKAGKMLLTGPNSAGKFSCTADKRKGSVSLVSTPDQLVRFRWTDRSSGNVEDDRIIMPGDATFKSVNTGKGDDRVYILKLNSGGPHLMYWLQDKSNEKDKENVDKLNDLMTNPSAVQAAIAARNASGGAVAGPGGVPGLGPEAWAQLMGLQQPPGASPGAAAAAAAAAPPAPAPAPAAPSSSSADALPPAPVGGLDFSNLLTSLGGNAPPAAPATAAAPLTAEGLRSAISEATTSRPNPLELQDIYQVDAVLSSGILEDEALRAELITLLPEGQQSEEYLETALRSPQLRDSMRSLSRALNPDNYATVMANFGLDPAVGSEHLVRGEAVQAFLHALAAQNPPPGGNSSSGGDNTGGDSASGGNMDTSE